jgi:hypothetical protein
MIRGLAFSFLILFLPGTEAASSGGKGKAVGSVAEPARGSSSAGSGGGGRRYTDPRKAPPLDPARKVSEQDCSRPIQLDSGNLRCK